MERFLRSAELQVPLLTVDQHDENNETSSERSTTLSDSTENIQALRADLQAATLGHVTPAAHHDDSSVSSVVTTTNRREWSQRSNNKKSSKKKKRPRKKRTRSSGHHRKIRSPDGDDSSSPSDESSSSSSSVNDSSSSDDGSIQSILAFGKHGSAMNIRDIGDDDERRHTSTKVGKGREETGGSSKDT
jgi:hypothetical protein